MKINVNYNITPKFQRNQGKQTVAMWLAFNGCLIPRQWMHDYSLKNARDETLKRLMIDWDTPMPDHWQNDEDMTIFDQAYFGIIPDIANHSPDEEQHGWTIAMILAKRGVIPPKQWHHDPTELTIDGRTVALMLAENNIIPPKEWLHDNIIQLQCQYHLNQAFCNIFGIDLQHWENENEMTIFEKAFFGIIPDIQGHKPNESNKQNQTVATFLMLNNIEVPKEWQYKSDLQLYNSYINPFGCYSRQKVVPQQWFCKEANWQDENGYTQAMLLTKNNIDIPEYLYHDPNIQNKYGETVAMLQAIKGKIPDKQWEHDPTLQSNDNNTVAMLLAQNGIIPPKQWYHDCFMFNSENKSVCVYLVKNRLRLPEEWKHLVNYNLIFCNDDIQFLLGNGYIEAKDYYIPENLMVEKLNDVCQICFSEGQQKFIKSQCGHQICFDCFRTLVKNEDADRCPICKCDDWLQQEEMQDCQDLCISFDFGYQSYYSDETNEEEYSEESYEESYEE